MDFCHGQAHRSSNHHHILVVGTSLKEISTVFDDSDSRIENGQRFEFKIKDHDFTGWYLTPKFPHPTAVRRLLRASDILLVYYTKYGIADLEDWMEQMSPDLPIVTLVADFNLLEEINQFHGTLSSRSGIYDTLLDQIQQGNKDVQ